MKRVLVICLIALFFVTPVMALSSAYLAKGGKAGLLTVFPTVTDYKDYLGRVTAQYSLYRQQQDSGYLSVASTPTGAALFIEGEFIGNTPVILQVKPSNYSIRLSLPGFADYLTEAQVLAASEKTLVVTLKDVNPTGASFDFPSTDLRNSQAPLGGFFISQLQQDNSGILYASFHVTTALDIAYPGVNSVGIYGDMVKTAVRLETLGLAQSIDHGQTWSVKTTVPAPTPNPPQVALSLSATSNKVDNRRVNDQLVPVTKKARIYHRIQESVTNNFIGLASNPAGGVTLYYDQAQNVQKVLDVIVLEYSTEPEGVYYRTNVTYLADLSEFGLSVSDLYPQEYQEQRTFYAYSTSSGTRTLVVPPLSTTLFSGSYRYLAQHGQEVYWVGAASGWKLLASNDGGTTFSIVADFPGNFGSSQFMLDPAGIPYYLTWGLLDKPSWDLYRLDGGSFTRVKEIFPPDWTGQRTAHVFDSEGNLHLGYALSGRTPAKVFYQFVPLHVPAPDAVYLYSNSTCADCPTVKDLLTNGGVSYSENPKDLDGNLFERINKTISHSGLPVVVVKNKNGYSIIPGADPVSLSRKAGLSMPVNVTEFSVTYPTSLVWVQPYFNQNNTLSLLVDEPNRLMDYQNAFSVWKGQKLFDTPVFSPRPRIYFRGFVGNHFGGMNTLMDPFNEPRDADDLVGLYLVQATDVSGLSANDPKIHGLFMDYRLYTTQLKQSGSGQTVSDNSIRPPTAPALPYIALVGAKQPFVDYGITEFTSDKPTYVVASESNCDGRPNCLVYDQTARKLHVRLNGDAQVQVIDDLGLIKILQVDTMPGPAQFSIRQANRERLDVKANIRFFKNQVSYRGDITGLSAELDGRLLSLRNGEAESGNDYDSFNAKFSGKLTKKAYLVMKNKQMLYGNFQKKPPFVTEFELLYMLAEAETVAQGIYGTDYASGVQISKSQWLKAYGDKDTSDVGLNPFMSLIAGGTTFSGTPVLRLPLVDAYVPGWYEDRDGSLVNFAHIYAAVAFGDLQESDLRNGLRALGYSYAGDRIFSYGYFGAYLFCSVLCWNDKTLALNNAINEAPSDEIIGDFYALDVYSQFRHSPARLSSVLRDYFGTEKQKTAKDRALGEVATFGYALGN